MSHYSVNSDEYVLIETEKIEVDRIVENTLRDRNIDCKNPKKTRCGIVSVSGRLNRMDDMEKAFRENKKLPPVKLKKHLVKIYIPPKLRNGANNPNRITYSILDGRHRVALSIIKGYTKIPAIIY